MSATFTFVRSKRVWLSTIFSFAVLIVAGLIMCFTEGIPWLLLLVYVLVCIGLLVGCRITAPNSMTVSQSGVVISRYVGSIVIPAYKIVSVKKLDDGIKFVRLAGNGGLFGYTGDYRNRKLGRVKVYATDLKGLVLIETSDVKYVVSCQQAGELLKALECMKRP